MVQIESGHQFTNTISEIEMSIRANQYIDKHPPVVQEVSPSQLSEWGYGKLLQPELQTQTCNVSIERKIAVTEVTITEGCFEDARGLFSDLLSYNNPNPVNENDINFMLVDYASQIQSVNGINVFNTSAVSGGKFYIYWQTAEQDPNYFTYTTPSNHTINIPLEDPNSENDLIGALKKNLLDSSLNKVVTVNSAVESTNVQETIPIIPAAIASPSPSATTDVWTNSEFNAVATGTPNWGLSYNPDTYPKADGSDSNNDSNSDDGDNIPEGAEPGNVLAVCSALALAIGGVGVGFKVYRSLSYNNNPEFDGAALGNFVEDTEQAQKDWNDKNTGLPEVSGQKQPSNINSSRTQSDGGVYLTGSQRSQLLDFLGKVERGEITTGLTNQQKVDVLIATADRQVNVIHDHKHQVSHEVNVTHHIGSDNRGGSGNVYDTSGAEEGVIKGEVKSLKSKN